MKQTKKQTLKKIISAILIVGIVVALVSLITWKPQSTDQTYTTAVVDTQDIERTSTTDGHVVTQLIDGETKKVIQTFVDEYAIVDIDVDQPAQINMRALDQEINGTVRLRAEEPRMNADTPEYELIIAFDTIPEELRNGMTADVTIVLDQTEDDVVAVPNEALYKQGDTYYVDRVYEQRRVHLTRLGVDKTTQIVEPVEVSIGFEGDDYTEITEGLQEGDVIAL